MRKKFLFNDIIEEDYKYSIDFITDQLKYNLDAINEIINSIIISNNIEASDFIGMMQLALAIKYMCSHLKNRDGIDNELKQDIESRLPKIDSLLDIDYDLYSNNTENNVTNKIKNIIDNNNLIIK